MAEMTGMMSGQNSKSIHPLSQYEVERERELDMSQDYKLPKPTSVTYKATPPRPPQTAQPAWDQVFKYPRHK